MHSWSNDDHFYSGWAILNSFIFASQLLQLARYIGVALVLYKQTRALSEKENNSKLLDFIISDNVFRCRDTVCTVHMYKIELVK